MQPGGRKMKNIDMLKKLKDYQLLYISHMLRFHVVEIQAKTGVFDNLDAIDLNENTEELCLGWLNSTYDEARGFRFSSARKIIFIKPEEIEPPCWYDPTDEVGIKSLVELHDKNCDEADEWFWKDEYEPEDEEVYDY